MRSALIMKVFAKWALLLFFISTAAVGAQQEKCDIWLAPLDREQNVNGQGAEDFMKLFESDAPWDRVSGHVAAFKIYPYFAGRSSDKNLRKMFIDLRRRNIALALEARVLTDYRDCRGDAGANTLPLIHRIKQLGGELLYLAMDEPMKHWYYSKTNCHATFDEIAANIAKNVREFRDVFRNLRIGDIEPIGFFKEDPNLVDHVIEFVDAYERALKEPLAFFHADLIWKSSWEPDALELGKKLRARKIKFGMIYNGTDLAPSSKTWAHEATLHFQVFEKDGRTHPDTAIFQSWVRYPDRVLPESDPISLTGIVAQYLEYRRTGCGSSP